jgi:hypothetical protein
MFIRRIDSSKGENPVGGTTKRIVVFLFGALFAVISVAARREGLGHRCVTGDTVAHPDGSRFSRKKEVSGDRTRCRIVGEGYRSPSVNSPRRAEFRSRDSAQMRDQPNKAPEPTSTSVMSRAIVSISEMKQRTRFPNQARATPAVVVAHL